MKRGLMVTLGKRPRPCLQVLAYHSIDETGSAMSTSPSEFQEHLRSLRDSGWRGLTTDEAGRCLEIGALEKRQQVLITFDDGYLNFCDSALPILEENGFPATVFVATDLVGKSAEWLRRDQISIRAFFDRLGLQVEARRRLEQAMALLSESPLMDWETLRALRKRGIGIESHGAAHHFLGTLSGKVLKEDLIRSRRTLESRLGSSPSMIAYPYGSIDDRVVRMVKKTGYRLGFVADIQGRGHDPFRVERIGVGGGMGAGDLLFFLTQAGLSYQQWRNKTTRWS